MLYTSYHSNAIAAATINAVKQRSNENLYNKLNKDVSATTFAISKLKSDNCIGSNREKLTNWQNFAFLVNKYYFYRLYLEMGGEACNGIIIYLPLKKFIYFMMNLMLNIWKGQILYETFVAFSFLLYHSKRIEESNFLGGGS